MVELLSSYKYPFSKAQGNAGFDVYSNEEIIIPCGKRRLVSTGLFLSIPEHLYGQLLTRSGMAVKGLDVHGGVIDSMYRGEIKVILSNSTENDYQVHPGDRIAQIVFIKIDHPYVTIVNSLSSTERGSKGFGSSGV